MLVKGDFIKLEKSMGDFNNVGEVCEVIDIDDNCVISFKFGNGMHKGCMSYNEFEEYFSKVEKVIPVSVDAATINDLMDSAKVTVNTTFDKCTVVSVKLKNGFVITESSACLDPVNYNEEEGMKYCMAKIEMKLWELEAYRLQSEIYMSNHNS